MMSARARSRSPRGGVQVTMDEIVRLVVSREQARLQKDFTMADQYRESLQAVGVTLYDKTRQWKSSDGRSGRIPTFNEIEAGQTAETLIAQQQESMPSAEAPEGSEAQIKYLIQQREQARANKDFAQSDSIRDNLKGMGVELFDKDKLWKCPSLGLQGAIIGFRSGGHQGPTDMEISTLVVQREKARQANDYALSDKIRDELRAHGVEIRDKDKIWKAADGRQGPVPNWMQIGGGVQPQMPQMGYQQQMMAPQQQFQGRGGGGVQDQLMQAAMAASQNPATAARTLQLIQQASGGGAQMQRPMGQPRTTQSFGGGCGGGVAGGELQQALGTIQQCQSQGRSPADYEITWLVQVREKLRQSKDFSSADALRNALRPLGIELYEKEKRWTCNDGRQGMIPAWNQLA
eukprot:TRINITY_DN1935_c0_g1_i1.p1 TRINITY_DN1935_c0_g1~~TRINITY_DN1935_c0_g1_i1.p1  ORF type:complete len:404 (+),score=109.09 TRINITY_DN1935_c0_g1_i1:77-1288(+)